MFAEVYESDPVPYAAEDEVTLFPGLTYNEFLQEPPRIYYEALDPASPFRGFFARSETTRTGAVAYRLVCQLLHYRWPGWRLVVHSFDGGQGAHVRRVDSSQALGGGISLSNGYVSQGRNNEAWSFPSSLTLRLLDIETFEADPEVFYSREHFTPDLQGPFCVDRPADRVLGGSGTKVLRVYRLSTGELLAEVPTPGVPRSVFFEDAARAWVVCDRGILVLVDYLRVRVLGVYRVEDPDVIGVGGEAAWAWDPLMRRVLVAVHTADAEDGASTTRIRGYYPRPLAVGMTPPIPLQVPRAGRTVDVVARVYGDVGEGIAGREVSIELEGDGLEVSALARMTDRRGYARWSARCSEAGDVEASLEVEV